MNIQETKPMVRLASMAVDREAAIRRKHGVDVGWKCPDCARAIDSSDWDRGVCPCGRPYPFSCGRECGRFVHPERPESGRWYECYTECDECGQRTRRGQIEKRLDAIVPKTVLAAARDYQPHPHRRALATAAKDWLSRRCGRSGGWSSIYIHGNTGSGKSVGAAGLVTEAMARGIVRECTWLLEEDLVEAAKTRFRDADPDSEERTPAQLIQDATRVELLVVDELFSRGAAPYTENASLVVGSLFRSRFDAGLPTIVTSNSPLTVQGRSMWAVIFDSRIESRWHAVGHAVTCVGPDLRVTGRR